MDIVTPHDVVRHLLRNAWQMSVIEFAAALGEDWHDANVQERHKLFQTAARALAQLDDRTIAVITARPQEATR